tara:strand:+ start:55510 stop:56259 length:750 start_codon:yes stop_codon:yes gene_type:complete
MLWKFCLADIKNTYAGSVIGAAWLVLGPLIFFCFYTLVYTVIFPFKPQDMQQMQYVLHVFCGISLFLGFSSGLSLGCNSLISNKSVLLNTVFPSQLIPIRNIIVPLSSLIFSMILVLTVYTLMGNFSWTVIFIFPIIISFIMMLIGLVWIVSLLTIVFRDIQQIIGYLTMFLLIISPIAYTKAMIPSHIKIIIYLNPLSYYIIPLQDALVLGKVPSIPMMSIGLMFSLFLFSFGNKTFESAKKIVFDYV